MACSVISNIANRYIFGKEDTYGTIPSIVELDIGHIQSITVDEDEGTQRTDSMNSGHTSFDFEDDLYNLSGTIISKVTKTALPILLEALFGAVEDTSLDTYTITSDPVCSDDLSYYLIFNTTAGNTKQMAGLCITGGEISVEKDGAVQITLNYKAQILSPATEVLSPSTNIGSTFQGLDAFVTYDGNNTIMDSFNISVDWNVDDGDSRGIEVAHANGRRVINRVIRNNLILNGNFESQMDDNVDTGYVGERTSVPIVLTLNRGSDNQHIFTIATARTTTRSRDLNNDNTSKKISGDFEGIDIVIVGDK